MAGVSATCLLVMNHREVASTMQFYYSLWYIYMKKYKFYGVIGSILWVRGNANPSPSEQGTTAHVSHQIYINMVPTSNHHSLVKLGVKPFRDSYYTLLHERWVLVLSYKLVASVMGVCYYASFCVLRYQNRIHKIH